MLIMGYEAALTKAWTDFLNIASGERYSVALLKDTYEIIPKDKRIYSLSCNMPAGTYLTIMILHYLTGTLKNAYSPSGEWISFKEVEGGTVYYPAFRESVIKPLIKKYGDNATGLFHLAQRFNARKIEMGDAAIEIETFPNVMVRIVLWSGDDEFGPDATILFDKNLTRIYSMEDIHIFLQYIVRNL